MHISMGLDKRITMTFDFCFASLRSEVTTENNMVISVIGLAYDQGRRHEFSTGGTDSDGEDGLTLARIGGGG